MPEELSFDAYRKWLGIPPQEQPPHHYRLLGVEPFEGDTDVIGTAADARMVHLRTFAAGEHSDVSQQILGEVATAQICLLDPQRKATYDKSLRERLTRESVAAAGRPFPPPKPGPIPPPKQAPIPPPLPSEQSAAPPVPPPLPEPTAPNITVDTGEEGSRFADSYVASQKKQKWVGRAIIVAIFVAAAIFLAVVATMSGSG